MATSSSLSTPPLPTPSQVAKVVGNSLVKYSNVFINWEGGFQYGGLVTSEGLSAASKIVAPEVKKSWMTVLDKHLDNYLNNLTGNSVACDDRQSYGASNKFRLCASALLSNDTIPTNSWTLGTVGDNLGSFPLAYLTRYTERNGSMNDALVALRTVTKYVLPFEHHLKDGTISRAGGCCLPTPPSKGNKSPYLWADDQFMGLALMARLSSVSDNVANVSKRRSFIDHAATMQLNYAKYLLDERDGLSAHGAYVVLKSSLSEHLNNAMEGQSTILHSCCKWGRANGWGALSRIEILLAVDRSFPNHPLRSSLLNDYKTFMSSMLKYQSKIDGRWHQVVNETSTYLETSVTAMMITALAKGITNGWLDKNTYIDSIHHAWKGMVNGAINLINGSVNGVCMGTGIQKNLTGYAERKSDYMDSAPGGVGSVLLACAAMDEMMGVVE
jgi:rhamnogalacturonyl hydrolase YesR